MSETRKKITGPMARKGLYLVVGAVLWAAAVFGLVDEGKIDAIAASPAVGAAVSWLAAYFTHRGSNSAATDADVEQARAEGEQAALARFTAPLEDTYGRHASDPSTAAAAGVAAVPEPAYGDTDEEPAAYPGGAS